MGTLAQQMADAGHDVTWWSATFYHQRKRFRGAEDMLVDLSENFRLRLIHTTGYRKNVSLARIRDHRQLERKFIRQARLLDPPDIILSAMPIPALCRAAAEYGIEKGVPVALDIRDLWPDVFLGLVPKSISGMARLALYPMKRTSTAACSMATAILGITPNYVEWGLGHARRKATALDRYFPMGYSSKEPEPSEIGRAERFWDGHEVRSDSETFIACFFGWLGHHFEIEPILEAARILESDRRRFRFVFCGAGDNLERYRQMAADLPSVLFAGFVNSAEIWTMMRRASVGLAPYISSDNFVVNLPNKPAEYMSGGLPIVSSLRGALADLLRERRCGLTYENGSVDQLVSILRELYDNPERRLEMARRARAVYEERFVAEKVYGEMIRHMEGIIEDYRFKNSSTV
jgi:glycosyltransferase involved in cell wall biosynthesis